jgi:ABC-type bacteriocin/lantibiotic exporter with double-glycine peptidase domain
MKKIIFQKGLMDCGPTCLLSIARHNGLNPDIKELKRLAKTDWTGTSIDGLMIASQSLGFNANGVWADIEALKTLSLPVIAHIKIWNLFSHYWVIYKIDDYFLEVMDPGLGSMRRIPISRFEKQWTKALVIFQDI